MKKLLLVLPLILLCIIAYGQKWIFTGDRYVAKTGGIGDLTSLTVDGEEFLDASYFYAGEEPVKRTLEKDGNKLIVKSEMGEAVFEFLPDKIVLTVDNKSAKNYFLELNRNIKVISDNKLSVLPFTYYGKTRTVNKKAVLESYGDMKLWGPWNGGHIAYDYFFQGNPNKITQTFVPASMTEKEYNLINHISSPLNIYSPSDYEVFQRQSKKQGYIDLSGFIKSHIKDLQYKIEGKDLYNKKVNIGWKPLKTDKFGVYRERVKVRAGGWYKVSFRYYENDTEKTEVIEHVGVGEIIVGAGQSNSTNSGQYPSKQESGMVSATDGKHWRYADDPMIGVHDGSGGGSFYPALGDILYKEFNVPIGIAATGHGGTSIESWQPEMGEGSLYNWFMERVNKFGKYGFRCVVWHQGEANAMSPTEESYNGMVNLIEQSRQDAGWHIPWFVAKVSYWNMENPSFENIRKVHQMLWDKGVAFQGPDTDILQSEYRDYDGLGIHFSLKGLKKHAEMWSEFLIPYIHSQTD